MAAIRIGSLAGSAAAIDHGLQRDRVRAVQVVGREAAEILERLSDRRGIGLFTGREQGEGHHAGDAGAGVVFDVSPRAVVALLALQEAHAFANRPLNLFASDAGVTRLGCSVSAAAIRMSVTQNEPRRENELPTPGLPWPAVRDLQHDGFLHSACHRLLPRGKTDARCAKTVDHSVVYAMPGRCEVQARSR